MDILITNLTEPLSRIAAIKELRSVTGLGLKEAKDIIDDVGAGLATRVTVREAPPGIYFGFERIEPSAAAAFLATLRAYDAACGGLTVGQLVRILSVEA